MIDNIILLITGSLHQRPISELVSKCHPLGSFEQMEAINVASTPAELYNAVLIDTPLGESWKIASGFVFSTWNWLVVEWSSRRNFIPPRFHSPLLRELHQRARLG